MGPRVSKAKGTKHYAGKIAVYLADFLSAAISAAVPAASADMARYDSARVSMTVASQAKHLPPSHGIRVVPSGRFPSDLTRPTGSLVAGKPALIRSRQVLSFMRAYLAVRSCPRRHERPCEPSAVTNVPQGIRAEHRGQPLGAVQWLCGRPHRRAS